MAATDSFRKQHAELVEIVKQIESALVPQKLGADTSAVRPLLSSLIGKLSMHLAMEDNALYPRLKEHANADVRNTATKFITEMSGIKPVVEKYAQKWSDDAIRKDAPGFCTETRGLFTALADRIKRENTELYAMVDRLG
jgi:hemerythrin-like domain-containing protein